MLALNDLYPALLAIWILPTDIICNTHNLVDMTPDIASQIRRSTQEPEEGPDILRSGTGYLNEPTNSSQETKIGKRVMKNYNHAYQGVQQYTH